MSTTIVGLFDDALTARRALEALRDSPIPIDDIALVTRDTESGAAVSSNDGDDVSAGEGAAVGAAWGAIVGGVAALAIPGIGPFIAGGALVAALTGAATGAVVGGITAAVVDFSGISPEEAAEYESHVRAGKTLVAAKVPNEHADAAHALLAEYGAHDDVPSSTPQIATYDAGVRRTPTAPAGAVDAPVMAAAASPEWTRTERLSEEAMSDQTMRPDDGTEGARTDEGETWSGGGMVTDGKGHQEGTGVYDADQWAGETQRPGETPGNTWTSGEVVADGVGEGQRTDTGTYSADQWVGDNQPHDEHNSADHRPLNVPADEAPRTGESVHDADRWAHEQQDQRPMSDVDDPTADRVGELPTDTSQMLRKTRLN